MEDSPADEPLGEAPAAMPSRAVFVEKPKANIYTMMLIVSFVALVIGSLCLAGEMARYNYDFKASGLARPM